MATIGDLFARARTLLQDKLTDQTLRHSDAELMEGFNSAMAEARAKRPDLFISLGLRNPLPTYADPDDLTTDFPLDPMVVPQFVYYLVGYAELRDDTFADNSRAVQLLNKFVTGLLQVAS